MSQLLNDAQYLLDRLIDRDFVVHLFLPFSLSIVPAFCITRLASTSAWAAALICSARCRSTRASSSASLAASTGLRLRARDSVVFSQLLVPSRRPAAALAPVLFQQLHIGDDHA